MTLDPWCPLSYFHQAAHCHQLQNTKRRNLTSGTELRSVRHFLLPTFLLLCFASQFPTNVLQAPLKLRLLLGRCSLLRWKEKHRIVNHMSIPVAWQHLWNSTVYRSRLGTSVNAPHLDQWGKTHRFMLTQHHKKGTLKNSLWDQKQTV